MISNINKFILFFYIILFSNSVIQNWIFENSAKELSFPSSKQEYAKNYEKDNKYYVELNKEIKTENGEIKYKKNIKVYYDGTLIYGGEVDFDQIDSIFRIGDDNIVCPKGKFQPHNYYIENDERKYSTLSLTDFVEKGDWKLKCFYHPVGFFIVFYLMNGSGSQLFFKQLSTGTWDKRTFHTEIYDVKLNVDNPYSDNGEYGLIYLVKNADTLKLLGAKYTIKINYGISTNDCGGNNINIPAKTNSAGCFENSYDHFYYFTYSNTSDFYCGYFDSVNNINDQRVGDYTVTKYSESPLIFVDQVEIQELKFMKNYKYAYYKIYNPINLKTYHGIIDTKKNLVVFNTDEDIVTYVPYTDYSMLAITSTKAYEICVIKKDGICIDSNQCTESNGNYILDLNGNKCASQCDEGEYLLLGENFCSDTCDESIYILKDGQCGLCKNFDSNKPYKLIDTSICLSEDEIPEGAQVYNSQLFLLKCKSGYKLEDSTCKTNCYEKCETCSDYSVDINNQKCLSCKNNNDILENGNCLSPKITVITTIITTIPTTIPTTIITTIPTTILTTIPTTLATTIPTTIITTIPTTIPTIIFTTIPTTIFTTIPTTILTTIPTTILTTIPTTITTTIPTTILTTIPTKIFSTMPTTIPTTVPTTIITTIPTTIFTTIPTTVETSEPCEEKCLRCNEESNSLGLCLSCNEAKGYKKVNYTKVLTEFYDCILNTSSKLNKFFFNETTQEYRPCYKTCKTCLKGGDDYANNCLECETGYMLRPGNNPYNNCVVYSDFYYISPYNQYKVLNNFQCPEESKYMVKKSNKRYCIYDCKADETNKYLYNGFCLEECPENTINDNYICKEIVDECKLGKNEIDINYNVNQETTKILVNTYISEFNYTNKYVSLYMNQNYTIIIYKNRTCISELSLEMPKVDFQECYNKVKSYYQILSDLIIVIIEKKPKTKGQTFYSFYHPEVGYKLDAEEICKNETIVIKENLTSILSEGNNNHKLQTSLTEQGINIFDLNDPFYQDLCYDFDNPSNKDIPLSERISTIYPDVSLCDEGCQMNAIDLESMTAVCNCKFNDIANSKIIKENALLDNVIGEVFDFINESNILVMKCYDYIFDHFKESIGGIISLVLLGGHLICTLSFFIFGANNIKIYIFKIYENYLSFISHPQFKINPPKKNNQNQKLKETPIHENNSYIIEQKKRNISPFIDTHSQKNNKRNIKIDKPQTIDYDIKNTEKELIMFRAKNSKRDSNFKKSINKKIL